MACDRSLLKVGSRLKDNDPRFGVRIVTITALLPNGVEVLNPVLNRTTRIMAKFIHTDGKPRRSGFSLVP